MTPTPYPDKLARSNAPIPAPRFPTTVRSVIIVSEDIVTIAAARPITAWAPPTSGISLLVRLRVAVRTVISDMPSTKALLLPRRSIHAPTGRADTPSRAGYSAKTRPERALEIGNPLEPKRYTGKIIRIVPKPIRVRKTET